MHVLESLHLGDLVELPDGRRLTVRSRVMLPMPLGSMGGFVLCGELEAMLSVPAWPEAPVLAYEPASVLPAEARAARAVFHGACSYWAPHLPGQRQGMGELLWKVLEVPGEVDPVVIVWRSREAVIFVRGASIQTGLKALYMPREHEDIAPVEWRSSEVLPSEIFPRDPSSIPTPVPLPLHAPVR